MKLSSDYKVTNSKVYVQEVLTVLLVKNEIAFKVADMLRGREGYEAIGEKHDELFSEACLRNVRKAEALE
ncbi:hypothetical protein BN2127_JRS1_07831 [Bacillus cereus]|nr:hypothetical protein BN2127_JRS1_07831 [Bacillus cereus]